MNFNTIKNALILSATFFGVLFTISPGQASPALFANGKIAFTSDRDGNSEIYLMNADGTGQMRLTNSSDREDYPTWSPDGRRIAFLKQIGSIFSINLMNADGTDLTELSRVIPNNIQAYPYERIGMSWSPDGTKIAFQDSTDILTINVDGGSRVNLTRGQYVNYEPSWSPDGSRLAFSRSIYFHGFYPNVYTMNSDGSNVTEITNCLGHCEYRSPDWSPDGSRITLIEDDANFSISLIDPDGANLQPFIYVGSNPKWSPDGMKIVFSQCTNSNICQIRAMNRDGSGFKELTNSTSNNFHPSWQPLTSLTVTRSDDRNNATCVPGDCSLCEAVIAANASAVDDTITFALGITNITLTDQIIINNAGALTINGNGSNILTIHGDDTHRIFTANSAIVTISGLTLTDGGGDGGFQGIGGAMLVFGGSMTLDSVHVKDNTASQYAGGVNFQGGIYRIINSTFSGNSSGQCGGFYIDGTLTIVNSTISGNTSETDGGGFCAGDGTTSLRNITITNNIAARFGGGIANYFHTVDFANTIVAGNTTIGGTFPEIDTGYAPVVSMGGNLVGDSPGDSPNTIVYQLTDIRDTNPLLGSLQNNGGSTPTHALGRRSPAIDKGLNAMALDPSNGIKLAFDQRGTLFPRIRTRNVASRPTVDIGAFEVQPSSIDSKPTPFDYDDDGMMLLTDSSPNNFHSDWQQLTVNVANIEELYSAVNNPQNAGSQIVIAPGVYFLSVNDTANMPRPNGGRLELQENMSLQGVIGDRSAVVIDAVNLPNSSLAALRIGKGSNAIEWLTIQNAVSISNIDTDLIFPGTAFVRIAHISSSGSTRGINIRNFGPDAANAVIDATIVDNEVFNTTEGMRIINQLGANGGVIIARLSGNRSHNNGSGLLVVNNRSDSANIEVTSDDDRFYQNALGTNIIGGLSSGSTPANGNTVTFTANKTSFENNANGGFFDVGGLVIRGAENISFPNGTSNNTVHVSVSGCMFGLNQFVDLTAVGARSNPESIGSPGMNNHVTLLRSPFTYNIVQVYINSIPDLKGLMNTVTVINH